MLRVTDVVNYQQQNIKLDCFWSVVLFNEINSLQLSAVCRFLGLQNDYKLVNEGKRAVREFLDQIFKRSPGGGTSATATTAPKSPAMALLLSNLPTPRSMKGNKESYDAAAVRAYLQPVLGMKLSALLPSVLSVKQTILNAQQQGNVASMRVSVSEFREGCFTVWFGEDGARRALSQLTVLELRALMRALPPSVAASLDGQRGSGVGGKLLKCDRMSAVRIFLAEEFNALACGRGGGANSGSNGARHPTLCWTMQQPTASITV
jgi:hypothetical protein